MPPASPVATLLALVLVVTSSELGTSCVGLSPPVETEISEPYAPTGRYSGHWGVDFSPAAEPEPVRAAAAGTVTFSGTVVENLTVTLDHGGGLRTSYSYLASSSVTTGEWVRRGDTLGVTGDAHDAVHFSVRIGGQYRDPEPMLGCRSVAPATALRLVPVP